MIKIPDFHNVSREFLTIGIGTLGRIRNKPSRSNPSFTLNDVSIEIPIHGDSHSRLAC